MPCIPTLLLRQEARNTWGIEGSTGDDMVTSFCCTPCVNITNFNNIMKKKTNSLETNRTCTNVVCAPRF